MAFVNVSGVAMNGCHAPLIYQLDARNANLGIGIKEGEKLMPSIGEIPIGMNVLHRCDNPPCIKLDHLFLGTCKDNTRDAMSKGRFRPSEFGKLAHQLVTAERL